MSERAARNVWHELVTKRLEAECRDQSIYMDSDSIVEGIEVNKADEKRLRYAMTTEKCEAFDTPTPRRPALPGRWIWKATTTTNVFEGRDREPVFLVMWTWENEEEAEREALELLGQRGAGSR